MSETKDKFDPDYEEQLADQPPSTSERTAGPPETTEVPPVEPLHAGDIVDQGDVYEDQTVVDHAADSRNNEAQPVDPEADEPEITENYDNYTVEELQEEADQRNLTVTGTGTDGNVLKADLEKALEEDDKE